MSTLTIAVPVFSGERFVNYLDVLTHLGAQGVIVKGDCDPAAFDGLILPGGGDVGPAFYGQENHACVFVDRALDEHQFRAADAFIRAGKPVLGTCRGHQLLNVYFGGTLIQHVPTANIHSRDEGSAADKAHPTRATAGSYLSRLYGENFTVNSAHHQAIDRPGAGLQIVQWSADGIIEGMRHSTLPVWGVQWHPERMCFDRAREDTVDGRFIFQLLLDACMTRRS